MNDKTKIEIIRPPAGGYRCALFDFDGTVSLIREGWQQVMIPYFCEELTALGIKEPADAVYAEVKDFVDALTGKQTVYQCMALEQAVRRRGGIAKTPGEYKAEYLRRLQEKIADRKTGLRSGTLSPESLSVKGSLSFVRRLRAAGIHCYLASGTDEADVRDEASLLGIADAFDGGIFGAKEALTDCSKEAVIRRLIAQENLPPEALLGFGDGFVEIELISEIGGYAVGVAVNEKTGSGIDAEKRRRLLSAGAGMILPDLDDAETLCRLLQID